MANPNARDNSYGRMGVLLCVFPCHRVRRTTMTKLDITLNISSILCKGNGKGNYLQSRDLYQAIVGDVTFSGSLVRFFFV